MNNIQSKYWLSGILVMVLTACVTPQDMSDVEKAKQLRDRALQLQQSFEDQSFPLRGDSIEIPSNALWLGKTVKAQYNNLSARRAVGLLLADYPVRFDLMYGFDPLVRQPHRGVIIKDHLDSIALQADWHYEVEKGVVIFSDWQSVTIPLAAVIGDFTAVLKTNASDELSATDNVLRIETKAYDEIEKLVASVLNVSVSTRSSANPIKPVIATRDTFGSEEPGATHTADGTPIPENAYVPASQVIDELAAALPAPTVEESDAEDETDEKPSFNVSKSANLLYVSATPNKVREVMRVLRDYNRSVSTRVIIDLSVYDVQLSDSQNRTLDTNLLRSIRDGDGRSFITSTTGNDVTASADNLSAGINVVNGRTTIGIVLEWMELQGTVTGRLQHRFDVLNNHAVTFTDTSEIEYIKSSSLSRQVQDGVQIITPEVDISNRTVGRVFQLLPTIIDGRINIQMSINERFVTDVEAYGNEDTVSGTLYSISNTDRMLPLSLGDGEARLLTYFTSERGNRSKSRSRLFPFLRNSRSDRNNRIETVIVISAEIAN